MLEGGAGSRMSINDYNPKSRPFIDSPTLFDMTEESRFEAYHKANPHIYELFKRFTFEKIRAGAKNLGSKAVFERIRWETGVETVGDDFKVNNIFTPFYARLFMRDYPEHEGFFRVRASAADQDVALAR